MRTETEPETRQPPWMPLVPDLEAEHGDYAIYEAWSRWIAAKAGKDDPHGEGLSHWLTLLREDIYSHINLYAIMSDLFDRPELPQGPSPWDEVRETPK